MNLKNILVVFLLLCSMSAHATVKCRSQSDYTYTTTFPGYSCPPGYYQVF